MPYNRDAFRRAKAALEQKRQDSLRVAENRTRELHAAIPALAVIDRELSLLGPRILTASAEAADGESAEKAVGCIKRESTAMGDARKKLLSTHGYPEDYDAVKFECDVCSDTGYDGLYMCECLKKAVAAFSLELSGIGQKQLISQSFETFSLDYYKHSAEVYSAMSDNFAAAKEYADSFGTPDMGDKNLLLLGGTGLGKTHLSTAIARVVTAAGNDVMYLSAPALIEPFEEEKFGGRFADASVVEDAGRILRCDLLIIDDLGTELVTKFSVSALYTVINTRVADGLCTIVSTNLSAAELRKTYADRITSRLFGEFRPLRFVGRDVRALKLT